jgi:hypothetical protein
MTLIGAAAQRAVIRPDHSLRSETIGSMAAARRAGM